MLKVVVLFFFVRPQIEKNLVGELIGFVLLPEFVIPFFLAKFRRLRQIKKKTNDLILLMFDLLESKACSFTSGELLNSVKHFRRWVRELNWLEGEDCFVEREHGAFLSSEVIDLFRKVK